MKKFLVFTLFFCFAHIVQAQTQIVKGQVKDENGNPVPFATVMEQGKKNAVTADENGNYTIKVNGLATLVISSSGHLRTTVRADGPVTNITLKIGQEQMNEVVVTTALGIRRQAKELGYAASSINNKTLTAGKAVNVEQALNGKISGVNVTTQNTGVFEDAKINIRGIRSLTGNNQPMLVVDGAPTPLGFMSSIPPDDIQDITVLKSAASAAIYGPDAVNGVIIITTKKGLGNQLSVTLNSTVQMERVAFFPKLQHQFGQGAGEVLDQYGNYGYVPYENEMYGPAYNGSIQPIGVRLQDGSIQSGPYSNIHQNDKMNFWNSGLTLQNSISIAGQDFYASVEDANIKGVTPKDQARRTSFRFNGGKKTGNFSINYGLNYTLQNYDVVDETNFAGISSSAYTGSLMFLVMQVPDNVPLLSYSDTKNNKFAQYSNYFNEFAVNPYWVIDNFRNQGRSDNLIGNLDMSYRFTDLLHATVKLSTNLSFTNNQHNSGPIEVTPWAHANRSPTQYTSKPGAVLTDEFNYNRINLDYFLSGDKNISNFSIKYIAGGMVRQNRSRDVSVGGANLVVPGVYNVATRSGDAVVNSYPLNNYITESRLISAYGNLTLGYKGFAFVDVTGRNDWDSRLLAKNRSFFYPGVNASVVLSDALSQIKNITWISYLKLRGAYSKSGNVNIPVYSLNTSYVQPNLSNLFAFGPVGFPYGNTVGFSANFTVPSANLQPEFVYTKEAGLEIGLFKNRVNFEATYFTQDCKNQILQVSQSFFTGYKFALANAANFRNKGVEMDLGLTPLIKVGKGRIDFKINATYNDNVVLNTFNNTPVTIAGTPNFIAISSGSPTANNIAVVGQPAFAFQLTDYNRDPQGHVIVDAVTGLPSKATNSIITGRTLPLWVINLTPSYSIGGLSVSMTWDYKGGHDFYSGLGSDMDFSGLSARSVEYGRKPFVFPNSVYKDANGKFVTNTNILVQDGNYGFWATSVNTAIATNYFGSAAAWRLRELNLSYALPNKWIGGAKWIKKLTISAIGRNLILLVPKSNQWGDPEFNFQNPLAPASAQNSAGLGTVFQSPAARFYGGSLTVQF